MPVSPAQRHENALDACARNVEHAAQEAARREPLFKLGQFRRDGEVHFFRQREIRLPAFDVALGRPPPLHEPRVWPTHTDWRLRYIQGGRHLLFPLDDAHLQAQAESGDLVDLGAAGGPERVYWFYAARILPGEWEVSLSAMDVSPAQVRVLTPCSGRCSTAARNRCAERFVSGPRPSTRDRVLLVANMGDLAREKIGHRHWRETVEHVDRLLPGVDVSREAAPRIGPLLPVRGEPGLDSCVRLAERREQPWIDARRRDRDRDDARPIEPEVYTVRGGGTAGWWRARPQAFASAGPG